MFNNDRLPNLSGHPIQQLLQEFLQELSACGTPRSGWNGSAALDELTALLIKHKTYAVNCALRSPKMALLLLSNSLFCNALDSHRLQLIIKKHPNCFALFSQSDIFSFLRSNHLVSDIEKLEHFKKFSPVSYWILIDEDSLERGQDQTELMQWNVGALSENKEALTESIIAAFMHLLASDYPKMLIEFNMGPYKTDLVRVVLTKFISFLNTETATTDNPPLQSNAPCSLQR
jgi:hypothetical protein